MIRHCRVLLVATVAISDIVAQGDRLFQDLLKSFTEDALRDLIASLILLFLASFCLCSIGFLLGHANLSRSILLFLCLSSCYCCLRLFRFLKLWLLDQEIVLVVILALQRTCLWLKLQFRMTVVLHLLEALSELFVFSIYLQGS